ncbi:hypothetical protein D910_05195 [Dendroctonus ponderosae]|uniref:DUF4371 domain-containing protein n=1 Tax=Dendroctonus ponderosae TaxID=77166 RepID=U4UB28_DENPD|nr:hypothetical protein D910_05195 [Dendroctonus ponderosae]
MHTSIRSIDHLTDIINDLTINKLFSTSSDFVRDEEKLQLHRTKCSALITFLIAPSLQADLIKDIANAPFSIIIDESTDVSRDKIINKEKCHAAKLLSDAYKDKSNQIILIFFRSFLKQLYLLNLNFQNTSIDYYKAFSDVNTMIWSLARQILKPAIIMSLESNIELLNDTMEYKQHFLGIDDCDFGFQFSTELNNLKLPFHISQILKNKCLEFIKVLLKELIKRMPIHLDVFRKIKMFNPQVISSQIRPTFSELPLNFAKQEKLSDLEILL